MCGCQGFGEGRGNLDWSLTGQRISSGCDDGTLKLGSADGGRFCECTESCWLVQHF